MSDHTCAVTAVKVLSERNTYAVTFQFTPARDRTLAFIAANVLSRPSHLRQHIAKHIDERPHVCSHCGKRFKSKRHLRDHITSQSGERSHAFSHCGKRLTQKQALNQHIKSHTVDGKSGFLQSQCGKHVTSAHLPRHMMTHTDERPYVCSECKRGYRSVSSLRAHFLTHAGERPHLCSHCGKRFTTKQLLHRHN